MSFADSQALSQGMYSLSQSVKDAMEKTMQSSHRAAIAGGSPIKELEFDAEGTLSVRQVTVWLREIAKRKSSVAGLSRFVEELIEEPHRFTSESVVGMLDPDEDMALYNPVTGQPQSSVLSSYLTMDILNPTRQMAMKL